MRNCTMFQVVVLTAYRPLATTLQTAVGTTWSISEIKVLRITSKVVVIFASAELLVSIVAFQIVFAADKILSIGGQLPYKIKVLKAHYVLDKKHHCLVPTETSFLSQGNVQPA